MKSPAPYDRIAERWDAARRELLPKERPCVEAVVEGVPPGARILDLGCGTGRPIAVFLASRGYQIVGVDESSALLELAAHHVPGGQWIQDDIITVELEDRFAAAICWDAIFHIERAHHRTILQKVYDCLLPGSRFALSCGGSETDIPPFTSTMFDHTFFYDAHPTGEMLRLVQDVGFEVVSAELIDRPDGGENKGRLGIVASRPAR